MIGTPRVRSVTSYSVGRCYDEQILTNTNETVRSPEYVHGPGRQRRVPIQLPVLLSQKSANFVDNEAN